MKLKKLALLIDLDNCLIDADGLKKSIESKFHKKFDRGRRVNFWEVYESTRKSTGLVEIQKTIETLTQKLDIKNQKVIEDLFYDINFKKFLFPKTLSTIKDLKKIGDVKIFSLGDKFYQSLKIREGGIEKIVGKNNVMVVNDKKKGLRETLNTLSKIYKSIILIDDRSDILEAANLINPNVVGIWIKRGRYQNILPISKKSITFKVKSFPEACMFINSFVKRIDTKNVDVQISVVRGISENQILQLVAYTKKDAAIDRFTHDGKRFKSKRTFNTWRKRRKIIYTITNSNQKLLGIVWFAKEKISKYDHTFAIRTYPPIRGKHLAKKIMETTFNDSPIKNVWLKVIRSNKRAVKLYSEFGFKKLKDENPEQQTMVYSKKLIF